MYHYKSCGLPNIWLSNGYTEHETRHGEGVSIHDLEGLHRAISLELVNLDRPLHGDEFRFLRIELDQAQKTLALLVDYDAQTIANWEKGKTPVPRLADTAIRAMYLEYIDEESSISASLKKLAALDSNIDCLQREMEEGEIRFEFMEGPLDGWHSRTAA